MSGVLGWYLFLALLGWLSVPLAYRVFANLPGRGFAFARPLGLLTWGFLFFLLASFHIVANDLSGVLAALGLTAAISLAVLRGRWRLLISWLRENLGTIFIVEALSAGAFGLLILMRAADPGIYGTEKPMEMAFINAILKSPSLPPQDPWLSGYSISYYYFGYLMVAMLTRVTGVAPEIAFNLAIAAWFALTAAAAYGVVYALLAKAGGKQSRAAAGWGLLGPVYVLIVSNLEGFLDVLHQSGSLPARFWEWLNIQELCQPPSPPLAWQPLRAGGIWWWRASRVLHDLDLNQWVQTAAGQKCLVGREIIDEFPFFSYLLSDLHPHVLGMPFSLLAIGLAMNLFFQPRNEDVRAVGLWAGLRAWIANGPVSWRDLTVVGWLRRPLFWMAAIALGGLAFMNTWDFPIYIGLFCGAYILRRYQTCGWRRCRWQSLIGEGIELAILLGGMGIALYFPFYQGFASQAGGALPSMIFFTRGAHLWVMFGSLLVPVCVWLAWLWRGHGSARALTNGLKVAGGGIIALGGLSFLYGGLASSLTSWGRALAVRPEFSSLSATMTMAGGLFDGLQGVTGNTSLVLAALVARLSAPGAWVTLLALAVSGWGLLSVRDHSGQSTADTLTSENPGLDENESGQACPDRSDRFVLLLILAGTGLVLIPEFFYLRDQFGWRMNTIFKFYFQAWILWGAATAYASARLWGALRSGWKAAFGAGWVLVILMGLVYPYFGFQMKLSGLEFTQIHLDGTSYLERTQPDDLDAIRWLRTAPPGVIVEAVGGSYTDAARVSTHTGLPAVLGWPGHESQWRGGGREIGSRQSDIQRLYQTADWPEADRLLKQYKIRYIYIGSMERSVYPVNETKFENHLRPVYQQGNVVIYEAAGY